MIISDQHKFIFVHVPKVGGTSIRRCLWKYASVSVYQDRRVNGTKQSNAHLWKHAKAREIRNNYSKKKWDKYFTFGFVRNPWDWLVSIFFYIKKDKKDPRHALANKLGFEKFVSWFSKQSASTYPALAGQKSYLAGARGRLMVDFVGMLESFTSDFLFVCRKLNLSEKLPVTNATKHKHYSLYYTTRSKDLVYTMFKQDVEYFKYGFEKL